VCNLDLYQRRRRIATTPNCGREAGRPCGWPCADAGISTLRATTPWCGPDRPSATVGR